jgi:hypothetical protein
MPNVEVQLPASIGENVLLRMDAFAGQAALVMAFRVVRPRFLVGGSLDGALEVSLQVITEQGEELWLRDHEVMGFGGPSVVMFFLPFTGGDHVRVAPSGSPGEIRSWEVIGLRLETVVMYRVHLDGTPTEHEVEVDAVFLEPR